MVSKISEGPIDGSTNSVTLGMDSVLSDGHATLRARDSTAAGHVRVVLINLCIADALTCWRPRSDRSLLDPHQMLSLRSLRQLRLVPLQIRDRIDLEPAPACRHRLHPPADIDQMLKEMGHLDGIRSAIGEFLVDGFEIVDVVGADLHQADVLAVDCGLGLGRVADLGDGGVRVELEGLGIVEWIIEAGGPQLLPVVIDGDTDRRVDSQRECPGWRPLCHGVEYRDRHRGR